MTEHQIAFGTGAVVVRDLGGEGPDVLFVHAPGFCSASWNPVAAALDGRVHAYAIDLPGHGASTVDMRRPSDAWESIVTAARELGLENAVLVGLSQGSHSCLVAATVAPDLFRGVVCLGGACVQSTDSAEDDIAFYTSPEFTELLRTRFLFGYRLASLSDVDEFIDRLIVRLAADWRVEGFRGLREETRYSIRPAPDGDGWINRPLPKTITAMLSMKRGDAHYPDESLYRRIHVPVLIVQLAQGLDQANSARERRLAESNPLVTVFALDSGEYPNYTRPGEVAELVLAMTSPVAHPAE